MTDNIGKSANEQFRLPQTGEGGVNPTTRGYGMVAELLPTLQEHGFNLEPFFDQLGIESYVSKDVNQRIATGLFRVVEGESLATDLEVVVPGNLVDKKAVLQGVDVVKIHFNLINTFNSVFSITKNQEEINRMIWLWEIGRYAGLQLHKQVVFRQWPIGFPRNFNASEFWTQLSNDLFPEREIPQKLTEEALIDHFTIALPERIATTLSSSILEYSSQATDEQLTHLQANLRLRALRPIRNSQDFGITSGTTSLYELGSVSPL